MRDIGGRAGAPAAQVGKRPGGPAVPTAPGTGPAVAAAAGPPLQHPPAPARGMMHSSLKPLFHAVFHTEHRYRANLSAYSACARPAGVCVSAAGVLKDSL